jgi:hypothetical protein
MPEVNPPLTFAAHGAIENFFVPVTGHYLLTAAGAQGGEGGAAGGKGAYVEGTFFLRQGDVLQFVVGKQGGRSLAATGGPEHPPCGGGGGGGTFVWKCASDGKTPVWPLLVAGGGGGGGTETGGDGHAAIETRAKAETGMIIALGHGGVTNPCCHFGGGGGAGWLSPGANGPGPIYCRGGARWAGGDGVSYGQMSGGTGGFGGGGGGGFLGYAAGGGGGFGGGFGGGQVESHSGLVRRSGGGSSYNSGRNPINRSGCQEGDGRATIAALVKTIISQESSVPDSGSPFTAKAGQFGPTTNPER